MKNQLITITLSEIPKEIRGEIREHYKSDEKSNPHYFNSNIPKIIKIKETKTNIQNKEVNISISGYIPYIIIVKATVELENIFDQKTTFRWEEILYEKSYEIIKKYGGSKEFSEIYSIFAVQDYTGDPEQFMKYNAQISSLLKSESIVLDKKETEYTISSQIKYAENDLAIIDWDGAFLFDQNGNFDLQIKILTLANLQLLRYRILDNRLDEQLSQITNLIKNFGKHKKGLLSKNKEVRQIAKNIIEKRLTWITAFETLERDMKLIGEWYSAKFYELASQKLKINSWKNQIKEKMDLLDKIYDSLVDNFTISAKERAEWVELIAFFLLQIGWFVLIILEFIYFTRK